MSMKENHELDRLITRCLDEEAAPQERRRLKRLMRRDPEVAAVVEETFALDREAGAAMRSALGRTVPFGSLHRVRPGWFAQATWFAAAACLLLAAWVLGPNSAPVSLTGSVAQAGPAQASWFAPLTPRDSIKQDVNPAYEQPQVRVRATDRNWIIVPGDSAGEYLLIEVDRVKTRGIALQTDF